MLRTSPSIWKANVHIWPPFPPLDGLLTSSRVWEETVFGKHILSSRILHSLGIPAEWFRTPCGSQTSEHVPRVLQRVGGNATSYGQMMPRVPSGSHDMNREMNYRPSDHHSGYFDTVHKERMVNGHQTEIGVYIWENIGAPEVKFLYYVPCS